MLWSRATVEQAVCKRAEIETDKNNPEVAVGLFDLLTVGGAAVLLTGVVVFAVGHARRRPPKH